MNNKKKMLDSNISPKVNWIDFLVSSHPNKAFILEDMVSFDGSGYCINTPDILLFCGSDICNGNRQYSYYSEHSGQDFHVHLGFEIKILNYLCRNCGDSKKQFVIRAKMVEESIDSHTELLIAAEAIKLGEWPPFGKKLPSKLISLVRDEREFFLKGYQAEIRGLGIGAFGYYRRVVESQKKRLIEEIEKVAKRLGATEDKLSIINEAKNEKQFKNAVAKVKSAIPESLFIGNSNPLTLLHNALSKGLHNESDEECLELSTTIRLILSEFAESVSQALKDHNELDNAVKKLLAKSKTSASSPTRRPNRP